jgi:hypothetical protein
LILFLIFFANVFRLDQAQPTTQEQNQIESRYPKNITDLYRGTWEFKSGTLEKLNFKSKSGVFVLSIAGKTSSIPTTDLVVGELSIRDGLYSTSDHLTLLAQGVYFKTTGELFIMAINKDAPPLKDYTITLDNATMIEKLMEDALDESYINYQVINQEEKFPVLEKGAQCYFKMMLKFKLDVPNIRPKDAGDFTQDRPYLEMTGHVVSPNCDVKMDTEVKTVLVENYYQQAVHYALLVGVASIIEILTLINQMAYANTQATLTKISLLTVGQQAVMDSYLCLMHLTGGVVADKVFPTFALVAFLKFITFSVFEMRLLMGIWKARRPQGFNQGWNVMRNEISTLYTRFYVMLTGGLLILWLLSDFSKIYLTVIFSFWIPQIYCNISRECVKPLLPSYIIGTTISRLAFPLYFYGCPNNFVHAEPSTGYAVFLFIFVSAQAIILLLQNRFGPRFFIPKNFLPKQYDYFRPIYSLLDEEDNTHVVGDKQSTTVVNRITNNLNANNNESAHIFECVICMSPVDPVVSNHMITPCNHVFHQQCLVQWMEQKLECPTCRRELPPVPPSVVYDNDNNSHLV